MPPPPVPVPLKHRRGWRPGLLLLGLVLVLGSVLGGILLFDSATTTTKILVAADDLERGQILAVGDVRIAEVSVAPELNVLRLEDQAFLGGDAAGEPIRSLRGFVPAGAALTKDHFVARSQAIGDDEALAGVRLESGQYPSALKPGDQVEIFAVGARNTDSEAVLIGAAEVWRVWQGVSEADRTEDLVADLLIKADLQPAVLQAHSNGTMRLTVIRDE